MAAKKKQKKKSVSRKATRARAKSAPSAKAQGGDDESSAVLRASAKSFAARLLR